MRPGNRPTCQGEIRAMTTSRSLPRNLIALFGVAALLATVILVSASGGKNPEILAGAAHAQVSAADSANGPVAMGNGVFMGGDQKHDKSPNLRDIPGDPAKALRPGGAGEDRGGASATSGP